MSGSKNSDAVSQDPFRARGIVGFLNVIEPLISQGRERLHQGIQALVRGQRELPFDPATLERILFASLPVRLLNILSRTMALELNVARLQGLLQGDTPEARFASFLQRLCRFDVAVTLFQEYPVLASQLATCINRWAACGLEFSQHLCTDWHTIRTTFDANGDQAVLVKLDTASYESRGGRNVTIATFSSGLRLVYKPRSLALDAHFQHLLSWLNGCEECPSFQTLKVLDRGLYGWMEFVAAQPCIATDAVHRFYERQGGYLALLYALEATDFHFGNVIAVGEHPVMIDVEALFHARIGREAALVRDERADSVVRVGLLPQHVASSSEGKGIDISGLGNVAGQLTPHGVAQWEQFGTDAMCLTRKQVMMARGHNRPTVNGADVEVTDHADAIAAGFTQVYRVLMKHRDDLLSGDGLVTRFAADEVRVLLRPTQAYEFLLQDSYHPDALRDALERDRLFDWLWAAVEQHPYLAQVIPAERNDLLTGDIPIFTTRPGTRDLWTSSNDRIANFFDEPSLAVVQRRLRQFSDNDIAKQLGFIRESLAPRTRSQPGAP